MDFVLQSGTPSAATAATGSNHQGEGAAVAALGVGRGPGDARSLLSKRRNAAITAGCGWRMSGTD